MIHFNRTVRFAALVTLALAPLARSQTRPAPPPVAPPATNAAAAAPAPDFSPGFAALHRLGVTNVSRAAYVKFGGAMQHLMRAGSIPYQLSALQCVGWQLSGDASNGVFLLADGVTVRRASAAMPKPSPMTMPHYGRWNGDEEDMSLSSATQIVEGVTWKAADLDADIKQIVEKLQKETAKRDAMLAKSGDAGDERTRRMMEMSSLGGQSLAPVLFFALHAADQGRTNAANQLAAVAMNLAGGRQRLLEEAVNELAGSAYQEVWRHFRSSGDWNGYGRDVAALAARFPRGWRDATNAVELAHRVQTFTAAGTKPAPLPGDLPAVDRALADALVTAPRGQTVTMALQQPGFWVLPRDTNDEIGVWISTNAHPLAHLLRGGTNSISILLALLTDQTTLTPLATGRPLVEATPGDADTDDMEAMMQREMMMRGGEGGFQHPASRADIAAMLLEPLVGQNQHSYRSVNGRRSQETETPLAERVRDWQAANAGLGTEELAIRLLTSKDDNVARQSADFLARSSSTSAWQRLEQHILHDKNPDGLSDVAEKYVRRRGREALPFVEAYAKRLSGPALPADVPEDVDPQLFKNAAVSDPSAKYRQKRAVQVVTRLKRAAENKPATAVLDEVAADKLTLADAREDLNDLWQLPPQDLLNAVVNSAAKATNSATRASLLGAADWVTTMARYRMHNRPGGEEDAGDATAKPPALSPLPAADAWKKLLADTRVPTNTTPTAWIPEPTVRLQAAIMMEKLCSPDATNDVLQLVNRLGAPVQELLLRRAASRLSGAADVQPPLPDAGRVPALRLHALTNAVPAAAALATLTPDECLALALALGPNPALAAALAPTAHRMRVAAPSTELAAAGAALKAGEGQPLSAAFLKALAAQCDTLAKQKQYVTFELRRLPGFAGVEASVRSSRPDDAPSSYSAGSVAVCVMSCEGFDERFTCHPGAAPAKAAAADDPRQKPTDDDLLAAEVARIERGPLSPAEAEAASWKRIDTFCAGDEALGFPAVVTITAVPTTKP